MWNQPLLLLASVTTPTWCDYGLWGVVEKIANWFGLHESGNHCSKTGALNSFPASSQHPYHCLFLHPPLSSRSAPDSGEASPPQPHWTHLWLNWTELKWSGSDWIEPSSLRSDIARPRTLSADQRKGATAAAPWTAKTARAPPPARIHPRWAYARTLVAYPWARTFQIGMPERGKVFCFFFSFLFCCVRLRPCVSVASNSVTHRARTARLLLLSACACVSEIMLRTDAYFVSFGVCVGGFRN
jgi:hypothetical protein